MRQWLKKIWKFLPVPVRESVLKGLCLFSVGACRHAQHEEGALLYIMGNLRAGGGISRSALLYAEQVHKKRRRQYICVDTTQEMLQTVKSPHTDSSLCELKDIQYHTGSGTLVVHLNPPQFLWLLCKLGRAFLHRKHIIAYWSWELEDIPTLWKFALRFVDAVEVPSTFVGAAVARNTSKPVSVRPHVVRESNEVKHSFCHNNKLRCLFIFDMASCQARKNPQAAIAAFTHAFTPEQAELTIKVGQRDANMADWVHLHTLAAPHPHVRLISGWLDNAALGRLFMEHDVYLSLHRSEGYGMTIREAMLRGLYVVATGWSGNMDYMEGERVFAVKYSLVPVNRASGVFAQVPNARWAEPDIADAATILKNIHHLLARREEPIGEERF